MSSENLGKENARSYWWHDTLDPEKYVIAEFTLESVVDPEAAALGMAREQSSCAHSLTGYRDHLDLEDFTVRIRRVESRGTVRQRILDTYRLNTGVYAGGQQSGGLMHRADVELAFPLGNFGSSLVGLWNTVPGEIFRLGFLNTVKLRRLHMPDSLVNTFPGPRHGLAGIRERLNVHDRPLFCRSCRPAIGLHTHEMVEINRRVLRGGFDVVKDDELTFDSPRSPFAERTAAMMGMKREVEDATGEAKLYFANITADFEQSLRLAEAAVEAGVDGLMVSPQLQGISFVQSLRKRFDAIIMAHNSCEDILYRHPRYGVSSHMVFQSHRLAGADLMILTADFTCPGKERPDATAQLDALRGPLGHCLPALPVIAGGKTPEALDAYTRALEGTDFMVIAATAVDNHPGGLEAGARAFREAWEAR